MFEKTHTTKYKAKAFFVKAFQFLSRGWPACETFACASCNRPAVKTIFRTGRTRKVSRPCACACEFSNYTTSVVVSRTAHTRTAVRRCACGDARATGYANGKSIRIRSPYSGTASLQCEHVRVLPIAI